MCSRTSASTTVLTFRFSIITLNDGGLDVMGAGGIHQRRIDVVKRRHGRGITIEDDHVRELTGFQ